MNFNMIMDALQSVFEFGFMLLKPIGNIGNWLFGFAIAGGVFYWSSLETKNPHPEEDFNKEQKYLS